MEATCTNPGKRAKSWRGLRRFPSVLRDSLCARLQAAFMTALCAAVALSGCLGADGVASAHSQIPVLPPPDEGENVTHLRLQAVLRNWDGDSADEILLRVFGDRADNRSVAFSAKVRLSLHFWNESEEEARYEQVHSWNLSLKPFQFLVNEPAGIQYDFLFDDDLLVKHRLYVVIVNATMTKTGRATQSTVFFYYPDH